MLSPSAFAGGSALVYKQAYFALPAFPFPADKKDSDHPFAFGSFFYVAFFLMLAHDKEGEKKFSTIPVQPIFSRIVIH